MSEITEGLVDPKHIAAANQAAVEGGSIAQKISGSVMPEDRLVIPLNRDKPNQDVVDHLKKSGYNNIDYRRGVAAHDDTPSKSIRIGSILKRTDASPELQQSYARDPYRGGIKHSEDASIVISRRPTDVAALSTHQKWQSCLTLGSSCEKPDVDGNTTVDTQKTGLESDRVNEIIRSGAHVAYLVRKPEDIDKHYGPIGRVTLDEFHSRNGHRVIRPAKKTRGDTWGALRGTVNQWAEENFPLRDPIYRRHINSYPGENDERLYNLSPEHDEYWKENGADHDHVLQNHSSHDVLNHFIDTAISGEHDNIKPLLENKNLTPEMRTRLISGLAASKTASRDWVTNADDSMTKDELHTAIDAVKGTGAHEVRALQHLSGSKHFDSSHLDHIIDNHIDEETGKLTDATTSPHIILNALGHFDSTPDQGAKVLKRLALNQSPSVRGNLYAKIMPALHDLSFSKSLSKDDAKHYFDAANDFQQSPVSMREKDVVTSGIKNNAIKRNPDLQLSPVDHLHNILSSDGKMFHNGMDFFDANKEQQPPVKAALASHASMTTNTNKLQRLAKSTVPTVKRAAVKRLKTLGVQLTEDSIDPMDNVVNPSDINLPNQDAVDMSGVTTAMDESDYVINNGDKDAIAKAISLRADLAKQHPELISRLTDPEMMRGLLDDDTYDMYLNQIKNNPDTHTPAVLTTLSSIAKDGGDKASKLSDFPHPEISSLFQK